jgi:AcrR family transcriptional regulator
MPQKKNPDTILLVPLSRERVLLAALRLADAEGLEALSMRNLAQELGVKAMSLYNHTALSRQV